MLFSVFEHDESIQIPHMGGIATVNPNQRILTFADLDYEKVEVGESIIFSEIKYHIIGKGQHRNWYGWPIKNYLCVVKEY